jgi:hypothetical protein
VSRLSVIARLVCFAATFVNTTGCLSRATYRVEHGNHEVIADKLDARWFTREITDTDGPTAVELVYCPIIPSQPTVCRSATVWQRDYSALLTKP